MPEAEEARARFVLEMEITGEMANHETFQWYAARATKNLTDQGSWTPKVMAWWLEDPTTGVLSRYHMGCGPYGETSLDTTTKRLEFPRPVSHEPRWIVDYAEIPDHPPLYVANAEVAVPEHCMHDIRECDWCITHPLADAALRELVGVT